MRRTFDPAADTRAFEDAPMPCSPAQLAANLRNSKLSTGPRTPSGKALVRKNALKHGLTGAGIVVPDEDVAVIQERFEAFDADLNPNRTASEFLVRHLALMSVRMERCARQEAAHLTRNMLLAGQSEADAHRDELQSLVDHISADPEAAYRKLQRSPRGIAWMIGQWEDLKADLDVPNACRWNPSRVERAENLIGHRYDSPHLSRIGVLSSAYLGNFAGLKSDDWPELSGGDRQLAAKAELARIFDGEIARLQGVLGSIDRETLAKIESGAMARALFDASKEAVLARKYEGAAERGFYKALRTILELNVSENANLISDDGDANLEMGAGSGELALNGAEPEPAPAGADVVEVPKVRRPPAPADRRKSKPRKARRALEAAAKRLKE